MGAHPCLDQQNRLWPDTLIMAWVAKRPGNDGHFLPQQLTKTAVEMYLAT